MFDQTSVSSASASGWRVGDVVDDLYEVREVITAGGTSVVHRVHHRGWNIDLAVKTPQPTLIESPDRLRDFETGAQAWVALGLHPHIVSCIYVRRIDGLARVFAEWVDGGNLSEAITSRRLYAGDEHEVVARVLDVAIQEAWGLDHVHSCGFVHLNVKPVSVMLAADGVAKVGGLLLARRAVQSDADSAQGAHVSAPIAGSLSPAYGSPEQAAAVRTGSVSAEEDAMLTPATDVWSWAISVWEMFTGNPPCRSGQAAAEAFAAFRDDPWVDDPRIPAMPDAVADLLARCLDPDARTRPRWMGELADELAEVYYRLVGVSFHAKYPSPRVW